MKSIYNKYKPFIILGLIFTAFFVGSEIQSINRDSDIEELDQETIAREYENSLIGCERGNAVREQIFKSVTAAYEITGEQVYKDVIDDIKSVPTADPKTGAIDCEATVQKPQELEEE